MKRVILVDVDGTLADCSHRQSFVRSKPKNWRAFNEAIHLDTPHEDIIWLVKTLHKSGCTIIICTARTADLKEKTVKWLDEVAGLKGVYTAIYMREEKDYRDDGIVKREILDQIREDGYDPYMVIDDRDRVVRAWRDAGIRCLQVADGNF
jgi:uncharacterized HAD superfamily protein